MLKEREENKDEVRKVERLPIHDNPDPDPGKDANQTEDSPGAHATLFSGHLGQDKLLKSVRRLHSSLNMAKDIRDFVKGCANCQRMARDIVDVVKRSIDEATVALKEERKIDKRNMQTTIARKRSA
ncbi:hypothetical protein BZG36_02846, partial [Bifiguratus adelaidae]